MKMFRIFLNDERGISAEVFKLAAAVILAASVFVIIIMAANTVHESGNRSIGTFGNAALNESQSNAEKIEGA